MNYLPLPPNTPQNVETGLEPAIIVSLQDPLGQGRLKIQTAAMSMTPVTQLPWARAMSNHSQVSGPQGSTVEAAHSFKRGDVILVQRLTGSGQDWTIVGHPGTNMNTTTP